MMKCIYTGNFNDSHKKRRKLMGSAKEKALISVIDKGIAPSVFTRREANEIMVEGDVLPAHIPSSKSVRQAKSKTILSTRLHDDPIIGLGIYKRSDGYGEAIQDIGFDKFFLHFWSDLQIKIYRDSYTKMQPVTISFDATGGVCKKIKRYDNQLSGAIFLYEGVMNLFGESFRVLSMLSEQHDNVSIFLWLKRWLRHDVKPPKVTESDQSLPLMSGIVQAFTQYNSLEKYLEVCFLILSSNIKPKIPTCFVRNDINHFIHLITQWPPLKKAKHFSNKELFSRSMGLLVYSTSMSEAEQILEAMFIVAFSPSDDKIIDTNEFTPCHKSREFLREKIRGSSMTLFNNQFNEKNIERLNTFDIGIYEKEIEEFNCLRSFKEWTKSIANRCKINIENIKGIGDNAQFEIELETYIVNAMKLFPCW
ncbi:unnamed protein product [Macrosiphum euphorbiae]|uniref:LAGLIDADG homing endonuclease n=1 Tax=Macrosiphum euphorbiae TaxID=13131 RepID=A0AAV0Y8U0_9HEMI|nr:unnamed protein product [Macrosiphum euphorbiae]